MTTTLDAIVLAGGSARRMGGADKTALVVDGTPVLRRVVAAAEAAGRIVVVGPVGSVGDLGGRCVVTREDPPGTGPLAAIGAGIAHVTAPLTAVLAGDLPFLTPELIRQLSETVSDYDVALTVDVGGRDQLLLAVWHTAALRATLARLDPLANRPVGRLLQDVTVVRVRPRVVPSPCIDIDTPADLATARELAASRRTV